MGSIGNVESECMNSFYIANCNVKKQKNKKYSKVNLVLVEVKKPDDNQFQYFCLKIFDRMNDRESVPFCPDNLLCLKKDVFADQSKRSCFNNYDFKLIRLLLVVYNSSTHGTLCCDFKEKVLCDDGKSQGSVLESLDGKIRQQLDEGDIPGHWTVISRHNMNDIGVQANQRVILSITRCSVTFINATDPSHRQKVYRRFNYRVNCVFVADTRQLTLSFQYLNTVESYDLSFTVDVNTANDIISKFPTMPSRNVAPAVQPQPTVVNQAPSIRNIHTGNYASASLTSQTQPKGNLIQENVDQVNQRCYNIKVPTNVEAGTNTKLVREKTPKMMHSHYFSESELEDTQVKQYANSLTSVSYPTVNTDLAKPIGGTLGSNFFNFPPSTRKDTSDFPDFRKHRAFYLTLSHENDATSPRVYHQWAYHTPKPCEHDELIAPPPPHSRSFVSTDYEDEEDLLPTPPPCKPVDRSSYLTPVLTRCSSIDILDTQHPWYVNIPYRNNRGSIYLEDAEYLYSDYIRLQNALNFSNKKLVILESVDVYGMYPTQQELNEQLKADYVNDLSRANKMCYNPAARPLEAKMPIKKYVPDLSNDISLTLESLRRHSAPKIEAIFQLRWKTAKDLIVHLSFDRKPPSWHELAYKLKILSQNTDIQMIDNACRMMRELPAELVLLHWEFLHGRNRSHRPCNRGELIQVLHELNRQDLVCLIT